jgi:hypothetical protein
MNTPLDNQRTLPGAESKSQPRETDALQARLGREIRMLQVKMDRLPARRRQRDDCVPAVGPGTGGTN